LLAVEDVSFSLPKGQFVSIVGRSGCGKTTILKIVSGLTRASSGQVLVDGIQVDGPLKNVGIVFQDPALLEWRRVLSNVMLPVEILGLDKNQHRHKARELLTQVGLSGFEEKYPYELSGGMRQRVALCRALVYDPSLLIMDEPFGALDAITRDEMNVLLSDLLEKSNKSVLFVTHSISEAVFLSDLTIVMSPRPGRVSAMIPIELPRPRDKLSSVFAKYVRLITESLNIRQ
jgi:NitT/TauT family transport system ATP-binding protein